MERLRRAKSTRLVSVLAILGLILTSAVMVIIVSSSSLVNPLNPLSGGGPNNNPGPTGTLVVQLQTNQDRNDTLGAPSSRLFPLGEKAFTVTQVTNSSAPSVVALVTDTRGGVLTQLQPGPYIVKLQDETLHITVGVTISAGNVTKLRLFIYGSGFPLIYSEESGAVPTETGIQSTMYVEIRTPTAGATAVPTSGQNVLLKVRGGAPGVGYLVNATVLAGQSTSTTQWLRLGTSGTVNPVNASSILLTTWTYGSYIGPSFRIPLSGVSADD